MSNRTHNFNNEIHHVIEPSLHTGEEIHIMTTNAYADRVMNIRMNRVVPSRTGYVGYTKVGFFITRDEAIRLRDALSTVVDDDDAWKIVEGDTIDGES
jgi:hypothetical protein